MRTRILVATITLATLSPPAGAQLVSVRCCVEQADLERIGECLSGPGDTSQPSACPPAATCVLGFGDNTKLMAGLCDSEQAVLPNWYRGYCSSWADETVNVVQECVSKPQGGVNLFTVFDDEGDGDLDLRDLAVFGQVYDSTPKLEQSDAVLVYVECCVPESVIRAIGKCLTGPGPSYHCTGAPGGQTCSGNPIPGACDATATCVVGFSSVVEVGDYLNKLCKSGPAILPDPATSYCDSWRLEGIPIGYSCPGSRIAGNTFFVVIDSDGDGDVDLADFSVIQLEFGAPEAE